MKDREEAYDRWWFNQQSATHPEFPLGTELLYRFAGQNVEKFDRLNELLKRAYLAGYQEALEKGG